MSVEAERLKVGARSEFRTSDSVVAEAAASDPGICLSLDVYGQSPGESFASDPSLPRTR